MSNKQTIRIPIDEYRFSEHEWQKSVRSMNKRFQVVCWHRRARKTTLALNVLIQHCCANRNNTYGYVAPTYAQAKSIAVIDPNMLKKYLPKEVCRKPFNESELRQEFVTGSTLEMKGAENPDSIRGVGWNGVVLEEWAMMRYGRTIWGEILEPVLRENKGWAIFIFTPKGKNFAYEYFMRARQDTSGDWCSSLLPADESGLIPADELEKAKESMPSRLFAQEFMCSFLEDASSVFRDVDTCVSGALEEPIYGQKYILGVDLGRTNDATVLTTIQASTNKVVDWQRFTDTGWALQRERIILTAKKYNNASIVLDATGFSAGAVIAEDLLEHPLVKDLKMAQMQVIPFNFGQKNKKALIEKLIIAIEQRLITFPYIPELIDELKAFAYEMLPSGQIRYSAPEGLYDDCVISLGLAVFGLGSHVYSPLNSPRRRVKVEPIIIDNI